MKNILFCSKSVNKLFHVTHHSVFCHDSVDACFAVTVDVCDFFYCDSDCVSFVMSGCVIMTREDTLSFVVVQ